MIKIDYVFLNDLFERVWIQTDFSAVIYGLKGIAIAFLVIRYLFTISKNTLQKKRISFKDNSVELPISIYNLLYYMVIVMAVISYDHILFFVDSILSSFVSVYASLDAKTITVPLKKAEDSIPKDTSVWESMKIMALEVLKMIRNPALIILQILSVFVWIIDIIISSLFIAERFFVLLVMKLTGPLAFCISLVPGFESTVSKWFSIYIRWFLLIIPYFLVNIVISGFMESLEAMFDSLTVLEYTPYSNLRYLLMIPIFIALVFMKFKFYITVKSIYNQLFDVAVKSENS